MKNEALNILETIEDYRWLPKLPELSDSEVEWCKISAKNAERRGRGKKQHISYYQGMEALENREMSYRAEFMVAKFFGFERPNPDDSFKGPDVGHWLQVRLNRRGKDLLVPDEKAKRDRRSYAYVLVIRDYPCWRLAGWMGGAKVFDREPISFRKEDKKTFRVPFEELSQNWILLQHIATSGT